jgi:hypothetical protein
LWQLRRGETVGGDPHDADRDVGCRNGTREEGVHEAPQDPQAQSHDDPVEHHADRDQFRSRAHAHDAGQNHADDHHSHPHDDDADDESPAGLLLIEGSRRLRSATEWLRVR